MRKKRDKQRERIDALLAEIGQEYPYCGFHVGDGWFPHVADALRKMSKVDLPWKLAQVKQKFCQLRIYVDFPREEQRPWVWEPEHPLSGRVKEVQKYIGEAEDACDVACEDCGRWVEGGPASGTKLCKRCRFLSNLYYWLVYHVGYRWRRFLRKLKFWKRDGY